MEGFWSDEEKELFSNSSNTYSKNNSISGYRFENNGSYKPFKPFRIANENLLKDIAGFKDS